MAAKATNLILAKRLAEAREAVGLSQEDLAKAVGMGQTAIGEIEAGRVRRPKKMREIARVVRKSEEWLLGETDADGPYVVPVGMEFANAPSADEDMTVGSETGRRGIPPEASAQLDVTAGMGAGGVTIVSEGVPGARGMTFAAEHVRDYWRLPGNVLAAMHLRPGDVTIIPVQGDSMAGTLIEDDLVFVDTRHRHPSPDGIYALADEFGGIIVKRLEMASAPGAEEPVIRIISDNPAHKPKEQALSQTQIIGRVIRRFGVVK